MSGRRDPIVVRLIGGAVLAGVLVGCGLGDLPTRPPTASPTASAAPTATATPLATPTPVPTPTVRPSPTPLTYVVRRGDTLTAIAKRFKTTNRSIGYWNGTAYPSLDPDGPKYDPDRIEVGWRLTITPGVTIDQAIESPSAVPARPRPSPSIPPAPTPPANGGGLLVTHGPRASNAVALTFDMGGRTEPALDIVRWLIDHDVPATLFSTGTLAESDPTARAVLDLAAAHPDLFTIANHTYDHPDLTDLTKAAIATQLTRAEDAISAATGRSTKPLYRPPYGAENARVRAAAASAGFPYTVMWDVDTIDWKPESDGGPTADDVETRALSRVQGGSIVLMHLGGWHTLEALPGIVAGLSDAGLVPVTLAALLGL